MSSRQERIYQLLPAGVQDVALSIEGARVARARYGRDFRDSARAYGSRSTASADVLATFRDQRLRTVLRDAVAHVPLYGSQEYAGLGDVETLEDLAAFPILRKADVRELGHALRSTAPPGPVVWMHTSGTSGAGLRFPTSRAACSEQWAVWWRYRERLGLTPEVWCGHFGGRNLVGEKDGRRWRIDRGQRRLLFSCYHTSDRDLDEVIEVLSRRRVRWIHGYPSFIALVAGRVLARGESLQGIVEWVTTGAENLTDAQRALFEEAFGVRAREHYGAAEAVANISECPSGSLHIDEDFSCVEVVDGEIVGTGFANAVMPLVRYGTDDSASLAGDQTCDCGFGGRVVGSIDGRLDDYLVLSDGSRLGRLGPAFKDAVTVEVAQFVQRDAGSARLLLAGDLVSDADVAHVLHELELRTGGRLTVAVERVSDVTRTATGKARLVVRESTEG